MSNHLSSPSFRSNGKACGRAADGQARTEPCHGHWAWRGWFFCEISCAFWRGHGLVDGFGLCHQCQSAPSSHGTVGKPKANVLAERLRLINPQATVKAVPLFYEARTDMLLSGKISRILSSTPSTILPQSVISSKPVATRACRWSARRFWTLGSTQIQVADLSQTKVDPLAMNCEVLPAL